MSRRYLRSDRSEQEIHFIATGRIGVGEPNCFAFLFKFIGKYSELLEQGDTSEIANYSPANDMLFRYENRGITCIGRLLRAEDCNYYTSRRFLVRLCRKWCPSRVIISFESDKIVRRVFTFIERYPDLLAACRSFMRSELNEPNFWGNLMPIQADFLSARNDDQHKDYMKARYLINSLDTLSPIW